MSGFVFQGERYRLVQRSALDAADAAHLQAPFALHLVLRRMVEDPLAWSGAAFRTLARALCIDERDARTRRDKEQLVREMVERLRMRGLGLVRVPLQLEPLLLRIDERAAREPAPQRELAWIEVQLLDEAGEPVPGVPYRIELSDRSVYRSVTNANGVLRYQEIPGGTCKLTFTGLDEEAWEAA